MKYDESSPADVIVSLIVMSAHLQSESWWNLVKPPRQWDFGDRRTKQKTKNPADDVFDLGVTSAQYLRVIAAASDTDTSERCHCE